MDYLSLVKPLPHLTADSTGVSSVLSVPCFPPPPHGDPSHIFLLRMTLLNYLAARGSSSQLVAALTLSVVWNTFESALSLEEPLNYLIFNRNLTKGLRNTVQRHRAVIEKVLDVDHVLQARSIREFDARYTAVVFGFRSCEDYYHHASPDHKVSQIRTPVLCLNAADDPFSPNHAIPVAQVSCNPCVALLLTSHGGHIGFLEGLFPRQQNYMDRVFRQFVGSAFQHREELSILGQDRAAS
ncbi:phospholipase ABHD3-like isoform X2 [Ascaphus truei]|uniref:phospholipase ABHD3-like isoform X2 n=1 Tax=Ascaphus truei TaxID=8439 RepID=UPI003F5A8318